MKEYAPVENPIENPEQGVLVQAVSDPILQQEIQAELDKAEYFKAAANQIKTVKQHGAIKLDHFFRHEGSSLLGDLDMARQLFVRYGDSELVRRNPGYFEDLGRTREFASKEGRVPENSEYHRDSVVQLFIKWKGLHGYYVKHDREAFFQELFEKQKEDLVQVLKLSPPLFYRGSKEAQVELLKEEALRKDLNFMVYACSVDMNYLSEADASLLLNHDFIAELVLIKMNHEKVNTVPSNETLEMQILKYAADLLENRGVLKNLDINNVGSDEVMKRIMYKVKTGVWCRKVDLNIHGCNDGDN